MRQVLVTLGGAAIQRRRVRMQNGNDKSSGPGRGTRHHQHPSEDQEA